VKTAVVFYDKSCLLCSKSVQFILKHDKHKHFLFRPLDSTSAKSYKLSAETVAVLSSDQNLLTHHKALKYILKNLPKVKWVVWVFAIAPGGIQRLVYGIIARNRKRWFGTTNCMLSNQYSERFID
jgi:predicted DCC family thiol-disulfide oxidoreductase YuxK